MAKNLWLKGCAAAAAMIYAGAVPLSAQMFEDAAVPTAEENQSAAPRFNNSWANPRRSQAAQPAAKSMEMPDLSVDKTGAQAAQDARKNAAEALSKSLAGKRGTSAIRRVYAKGEKPSAEEESLIFLFYKDFKINRTMGGLVMCDVRFIVLHTLENKINNLSFRLKWPEMETTLSYNEVMPNTETYFDYTLVGDGCYSMDKIPNVIVNRCRVKGLSQSACANKIRWLKK